MARSVLDRAAALAAKGRYGELVSLLEPQLPIYRESHRYYYLLGSACLRTNDTGGAYTYLKRAEQLDREDSDSLLCVAAVHLRRGETQKAVEYYLKVLELRPRDRRAARALAYMRRADAEEGLPRLIESGAIERFYPRERGLPPYVLPVLAVVAVLAAGWLLFPLARGLYGQLAASRSARPEVAAIALSDADRVSPVEVGGSYRYILTEKQALAAFEKAKALFEDYRDNAALVELNRLLLSNASAGIRDKARALKSFVRAPDFRTVRDVPDYQAVAKEAELYDGCAILWKGTAANIAESGGITSFHFLVGYVDRKRLEGIVPVTIAGEKTLVPTDAPFELLGSLRVGRGGIAIDATAIHVIRGQ
jgi:tetratricopeptide (TPR) repeat protein